MKKGRGKQERGAERERKERKEKKTLINQPKHLDIENALAAVRGGG